MELQYRGSGKAYLNETEYRCDLYYNEKQGGIILKINVKNEKTLGNFLQVPLEIPHLCGQLENGFKFTLLQLRRTNNGRLNFLWHDSIYFYCRVYFMRCYRRRKL